MIVRKIRPEELKRTKELFAVAFDAKYENDKNALEVYDETCRCPRSREDVNPLDKYAAFEEDDKTMISCIFVTRYPMQFDGSQVKMAGIGGVSSLPQYRRRGGIRACFTKMLPELYREGIAFSCLYPFSTAYYRKFGYEVSAKRNVYEWKLSYIPDWKSQGYCVLVDKENQEALLPDIKRVYECWQERYNLMICNETWEYRFVTEANPYQKLEYTYVYYKENHTPAGYITFRKERTTQGQMLDAARLVFADAAGFRGILSLVRSFASDYYAIRFCLPDDWQIEPFTPELSFGACIRTYQNLGMVRVINVEMVLKLARYRGSGEFSIRIHDEQIAENNAVFHVRFENDRAVCVERFAPETKAQITMPIHEFSRLIIGVFSTETMMLCENIRLADDVLWSTDTLTGLGGVFYKKPCYLMEYF